MYLEKLGGKRTGDATTDPTPLIHSRREQQRKKELKKKDSFVGRMVSVSERGREDAREGEREGQRERLLLCRDT